jgi:hypothetical protein
VERGAAGRQLAALPHAGASRVRADAQARFSERAHEDGTVGRALSGRLLQVGPGLTANLVLKENWGRPRPNSVEQFAGNAPFQPWWRPSQSCQRNCSFVSGEASQAFWTVAPASLAPRSSGLSR